MIIQGRNFNLSDFESQAIAALVRSDSYLVGREERYIPDDVNVIGYYDGKSSPFKNEYVYTLFTQDNVHGVYYIGADDPELAMQFAAVLERYDYVVTMREVDPNVWSIVQSEPLTYAYEASMLLAYGSILLLFLNWIAANKRRYLIERLYGAHPVSFIVRWIRCVVPAGAIATAVGATIGMVVLGRLGALSVEPGLLDIVGITVTNAVVLGVFFALAVGAQTMMWGRR